MNHNIEISSIISKLPTHRKLGQLLMLDFRYWGRNSENEYLPFTALNNIVKTIINNYNLGGIALFRENTETPEQIVKLTHDIQNSAEIPLLIGIDQEGGTVTRLQTGTDMPGNMSLGAANDPELTERTASAIGTELHSLGINLNFAPDIDVNSNQSNPIIGVRSFGSSPELVSKMGKAYIKGLKGTSVISCAKHFPGHGNTAADTHLSTVVLNDSIEKIESIDLKPFYDAIHAGVDTIMAAHITVPALDNTKTVSKKNGKQIGLPATFSKKILTDVLRKQMNFDGVILTDALDMKAISDNFGNEESVILSILAGADMPIMPIRIWNKKDIYKIDKLITRLETEYNNNLQFKNRVNESLTRILSLKSKYNILCNDKANKEKLNKLIEKAKITVGCRKHKKLEFEASSRGLTLIKNENSILPYYLKNNEKIILLDTNKSRIDLFSKEFDFIKNKLKIYTELKTIKISYKKQLTRNLKKEITTSSLVILNTYNLQSADNLPEDICSFSSNNNIPTVVVSCRNPYDIAYIPNCRACIAIYGVSGFDRTNALHSELEVNIKTVVRALFSSHFKNSFFIKPTGKLPVDIKSYKTEKNLYKSGFGLTY